MKTKTLVALFVLVALATFCTFGYWRYHYLIDAMLIRQSNPNYGLISPLQSAENQPAPAYDVPQEDEPLPFCPKTSGRARTESPEPSPLPCNR